MYIYISMGHSTFFSWNSNAINPAREVSHKLKLPQRNVAVFLTRAVAEAFSDAFRKSSAGTTWQTVGEVASMGEIFGPGG